MVPPRGRDGDGRDDGDGGRDRGADDGRRAEVSTDTCTLVTSGTASMDRWRITPKATAATILEQCALLIPQ